MTNEDTQPASSNGGQLETEAISYEATCATPVQVAIRDELFGSILALGTLTLFQLLEISLHHGSHNALLM
jgi:hypothetical protein